MSGGLRFYLMDDEEKKSIATYLVNNGWNLSPEEAGNTFNKCKICHNQSESCTGHYGLLDLGIKVPHPFYPDSSMRYILIPPPGIRCRDDVEWPDDLSKLYISLFKLVRNQESTEKNKYKTDLIEKLKELFGSKNKSGLMTLLSSKDGIFRQIVFGKRINSSARSVIIGDPTLDIDQVYIPHVLVENLYVKEEIVDNKDNEYFAEVGLPLSYEQAIPGILAFRRIRDDDIVLINRQPTLSYGSILSFRAKIRKDNVKAIGIHPNVTKTFNADFDGDEMNIFCFPYTTDLDKCCITNFPECISEIQDSTVAKYMIEKGIIKKSGTLFETLDRYGLTVSLRDLVEKKYNRTGMAMMIDSKSKGNAKNSEQMIDKVGVQYLNGQKIGECTSSYVKGLNPQEFFVHQKAAREGIVSTGVSTSDTGYLNRKGCRIMADVVKEGKVIRDGYGIIDF